MITSTNLKALRNLEAFQVYSDLAAFLKQEEKGKEFEEPLKGVCDTFYARLQDYDTALSPERRNPARRNSPAWMLNGTISCAALSPT